ncbi:glucose-6-phosphate isomerase [Aquibaculum sediminis]|uniref:glucose-6-phosphate isomerase n=1 Tax=Aquibaculum sediminis TaxID=3231907 RepID=UPI0034555633
MSLAFDLSGCLSARLGQGALEESQVLEKAQSLRPALDRLAAQRSAGEGDPEFLLLPDRRADLEPARDLAFALSETCDDVLILGTGGSSLGGQTLYALADAPLGPAHPRLHFLDNVDPFGFERLLDRLDLERTGVVAVSKSGGTAETLCQFAVIVEAMIEALDESRLASRVAVITEPKDSPLAALAERWRLPRLDHDLGVGGRFSVLSVVGLLPALLAGLDAAAFREGAAAVLDRALGSEGCDLASPAAGAALAVLAAERGYSQSVLMPYVDRLADFGLWYRQLWAESLGKHGKGTTPIRALGPVDQHSQLQLYLQGPADKLFTLIRLETEGEGPRVAPQVVDDPRLEYLAGRRMGDLLDAMARATAETLIRNGKPTRTLVLERLDEEVLGGLFMHFMLETILAAELLGVDAYDQPAVEEGKVLARDYLAVMQRD